MSNKLKDAGTSLLGIVVFLAILAIPALFLVGAKWLSERLLPWFILASTLALAFVLFVVLPLSVFRRCQGFSAMASLVASFVFGVTLWMWALLLTLALWGTWAVVIGLFMMGVGVVPFAMLATLFKGLWSILGQLVVLTVLTFGTRFFAFWIGDRANFAEEAVLESEAYEQAIKLKPDDAEVLCKRNATFRLAPAGGAVLSSPRTKKSTLLGILSLAFGVIGIFWWSAVMGIIAIILGIVQLTRHRSRLAIAGLVLGVIDILLAVFWYRVGLMPSIF